MRTKACPCCYSKGKVKKKRCTICMGKGRVEICEPCDGDDCAKCGGWGYHRIIRVDGERVKCKSCFGSGKAVSGRTCLKCDGYGILIICPDCEGGWGTLKIQQMLCPTCYKEKGVVDVCKHCNPECLCSKCKAKKKTGEKCTRCEVSMNTEGRAKEIAKRVRRELSKPEDEWVQHTSRSEGPSNEEEGGELPQQEEEVGIELVATESEKGKSMKTSVFFGYVFAGLIGLFGMMAPMTLGVIAETFPENVNEQGFSVSSIAVPLFAAASSVFTAYRTYKKDA